MIVGIGIVDRQLQLRDGHRIFPRYELKVRNFFGFIMSYKKKLPYGKCSSHLVSKPDLRKTNIRE